MISDLHAHNKFDVSSAPDNVLLTAAAEDDCAGEKLVHSVWCVLLRNILEPCKVPGDALLTGATEDNRAGET